MGRVTLKQGTSEAAEPGTWWGGIVARTPFRGPYRTALIACPDCGTVLSLMDHTICTDGRVAPSVVHKGCTFHEPVMLEDWTAEPSAPTGPDSGTQELPR